MGVILILHSFVEDNNFNIKVIVTAVFFVLHPSWIFSSDQDSVTLACILLVRGMHGLHLKHAKFVLLLNALY